MLHHVAADEHARPTKPRFAVDCQGACSVMTVRKFPWKLKDETFFMQGPFKAACQAVLLFGAVNDMAHALYLMLQRSDPDDCENIAIMPSGLYRCWVEDARP